MEGVKGIKGYFWEKMGPSCHIIRGKTIKSPYVGSNKLPNYRRNPEIFYFPLLPLAKFGLSPHEHGCQPTYFTNLKKKKTLPARKMVPVRHFPEIRDFIFKWSKALSLQSKGGLRNKVEETS